jgi:hypothetical protein
MTEEVRLRLSFRNTIDAVARPRPWLAHEVEGTLLAGRRKGAEPKPRAWLPLGLAAAVFAAMIGLAALLPTLAGRHPAPAGRPASNAAYVRLVQADYHDLDVAWEGAPMDCVATTAPPCPARLDAIEAATEKFLNDLEATTPPTALAAKDAELRSELRAELVDDERVRAAYNAKDEAAFNRAEHNASAVETDIASSVFDIEAPR